MYHKNAMAGAFKPLLHVGGSVVILPDFEPRRFLETLSAYRCTNAGAVPAVYTLLLQHHDLIDGLDFSALVGLSVGSAPVQPALMRAVEDGIKAFCLAHGPAYAHPRRVAIGAEMPLNGAGKVDRQVVRDLAVRLFAAELGG